MVLWKMQQRFYSNKGFGTSLRSVLDLIVSRGKWKCLEGKSGPDIFKFLRYLQKREGQNTVNGYNNFRDYKNQHKMEQERTSKF